MFGLDVMLVDDEEGIRQALGAFLRFRGYRVLELASVEDALQALQATLPASLVTDEQLGQESGMRILDAYCSLTDLGRAALTTANERDATTAYLAAHPRIDRLPKPLNPRELLAWVAQPRAMDRPREEPTIDDVHRALELDPDMRRRLEDALAALPPGRIETWSLDAPWLGLTYRCASSGAARVGPLTPACDVWQIEGGFAIRVHKTVTAPSSSTRSMLWLQTGGA